MAILGKGNGLDSNYIYAVCEDAEGSIWIGAVDGGLTQIRDEKITALTDREGLNGDQFRCLLESDAGALWIGGFGGCLNRYQNGRCENFSLPTRLKNNTVYSLEKDADGSLWLGTDSDWFFFMTAASRKCPYRGQTATLKRAV